jgi:hypothetical protein
LIGNCDVARFSLVTIEPSDSDCFDMGCEVIGTVNQTQVQRAIYPLNSPYRLVVVCARKVREQVELHDVAVNSLLVAKSVRSVAFSLASCFRKGTHPPQITTSIPSSAGCARLAAVPGARRRSRRPFMPSCHASSIRLPVSLNSGRSDILLRTRGTTSATESLMRSSISDCSRRGIPKVAAMNFGRFLPGVHVFLPPKEIPGGLFW